MQIVMRMHLKGTGVVSEVPDQVVGEPTVAPWLQVTGQRWKVRAFLGAALACLAAFALATLEANGVRVSPVVRAPRSIFAAMAVGGAGFAWLILSVRCARCRRYPTWFLMRTAPASNWLTTLLTAAGCPVCGDEPARKAAHDD